MHSIDSYIRMRFVAGQDRRLGPIADPVTAVFGRWNGAMPTGLLQGGTWVPGSDDSRCPGRHAGMRSAFDRPSLEVGDQLRDEVSDEFEVDVGRVSIEGVTQQVDGHLGVAGLQPGGTSRREVCPTAVPGLRLDRWPLWTSGGARRRRAPRVRKLRSRSDSL